MGKTTLAMAVRDARAPNAAAVSIDQFYPCVASAYPNGWHLFATLTEITFATAAAFARAGLDVVVDTVFERPACLETARSVLAGHRYYLIALTCSMEVLEDRERNRGNRRPGHARGQFDRVLQNARYDLTLDTGILPVKECVDRLMALVRGAGST